MAFLHSMTCRTDGIRRTAPVRWRSYDGMCAVYWEACGEQGATGYYLSPDPRVMLFFEDVSAQISVSAGADEGPRPLLRALYVPAGLPLWTRFGAEHRFSHLDLHLRRDWLEACLSPLTGSEIGPALSRPVAVQDLGSLAAVAATLRDEVCAPSRPDAFAEALGLALVAGLLDRDRAPVPVAGGLTPLQMRRLATLLRDDPARALSNARMAEAVGLSPSWFAKSFKKTTGQTPLHWQQQRRLEMVKTRLLAGGAVLADVAMQFGFADQAHLTRVFRRHEGTTPAAWLRARRLG
ncbi:AraC family transcriptional regulator [Frigidibacter sp. MR17.14]|uniref:helix-turn-helix domain-containing protein n=1 Tax=Frigidibacter sp. MR17.14 TaxID=3126509 RepID=UPI003012DC22